MQQKLDMFPYKAAVISKLQSVFSDYTKFLTFIKVSYNLQQHFIVVRIFLKLDSMRTYHERSAMFWLLTQVFPNANVRAPIKDGIRHVEIDQRYPIGYSDNY